MKTRRIHLQPDEVVEVINPYGTSMLKAVARFEGTQPVIVLYEQPEVITIDSIKARTFDLSIGPIYPQEPQIPEQFAILEKERF